MVSVYNKIVHLWIEFFITAESLYILCKKNIPFCWQQEQQAAFEKLKDRLVSVPELAYPNTGRRQQNMNARQKLHSQLTRAKDQYTWENLETIIVNGFY